MLNKTKQLHVCAAAAAPVEIYDNIVGVCGGAASAGRYGHLPVHAAALGGNLALLRHILAGDPSQINARDTLCGRTPLMVAVSSQIRPRARPSRAASRHPMDLVFNCSETNDAALVKDVEKIETLIFGDPQVALALVLVEMGADLCGILDNHGRTCIEWLAVAPSEAPLLRVLSTGRADVNWRSSRDRVTLTMRAVANKLPGRVKLLLEAGADASATTRKGKTALHVAVEVQSEDCIRELLPCSCKRAIDDKWETPRLLAMSMGAPTRVQKML
jgi:ankyrin repeat protein